MPKVCILLGELIEEDTYSRWIINESTNWEDISDEDLAFLKKYRPYGYHIINQVTVKDAMLSAKAVVDKIKKEQAEARKWLEKETERKKRIEAQRKETSRVKELNRYKKLKEKFENDEKTAN